MRARLIGLAVVAAFSVGCAYYPGGTNLHEVAQRSGLTNVTTGDGTFENYRATGHHSGLEFGVALGLGVLKLFELYPKQSNEDLLTEVARDAQRAGANAMINVTPHKEWFFGFPFIIVGIYVDRAEGTGIQVRN